MSRRFNFSEGPRRRFSENGNGHHKRYSDVRRIYRPGGNGQRRRMVSHHPIPETVAAVLRRPRKAPPPTVRKSLPERAWGLLKRLAGGIASRIASAARGLRRKLMRNKDDDAYYRVFGV